MSAYREWFRVAIEHAYHGQGRFSGWRAVPVGSGRAVMDAAGAVLRPVPRGFAVLARTDRLALLPGGGEDGGAPALLFRIDVDDPLFSGYTMPAAAQGRVGLADSRQAVAEPSGVLRLHRGEYLGEDDLAAQEQLCDAGLPRTGSPRPPALLLRIEPPLAADAPAPRYVVRLDAVASYWKYYLLDALAGRTLAIVDTDQEVAFRRVEEEPVLDGRRAAVFLSDRPIALRERSTRRFELRERAAFGDRVLVKRLPVACAGIRRRAEVDGHAVLVSEIFFNY